MNKLAYTRRYSKRVLQRRRKLLTPEVINEGARAIAALVLALCPVCGAVVEQEDQAGKGVYAMPCGHRTHVGKARSIERLEQIHQAALKKGNHAIITPSSQIPEGGHRVGEVLPGNEVRSTWLHPLPKTGTGG